MEGSPVRGHQKVPITQLNELDDLQSFHLEIVRLLSSGVKHAEIFFGEVEAESKLLLLPVWIRSHLERHPFLQKKLEQGEMVGITATEENPVPRPAPAARSGVVLVPLITASRLNAAIALVSPSETPQLSSEDIEAVRQFAHDVAPILARLQTIERLRRETRELQAKVDRAGQAEETLTSLSAERNGLDAVLQMRSHQQVNIAHELRTPLAAIRGYARMILDGRAGEINERQRDYLRIVTDNTNRLIALVGWMSYVADLSERHMKVSAFDFRGLWTECVTANRDKLAEKSLKLSQRIAEEPFVMIGDREKLASVLDDLIDAAAKLADNGGTLTAELSHGREHEVSFKLSETGAALPADAVSQIFDRPFNTARKPSAPDAESSALSLSAVYDVVGMHGGRFFVNNSAGQGANFLFTLPAITASEEKNHEQAVNSSRRRR
jgi:signal transduction histidine kinase